MLGFYIGWPIVLGLISLVYYKKMIRKYNTAEDMAAFSLIPLLWIIFVGVGYLCMFIWRLTNG